MGGIVIAIWEKSNFFGPIGSLKCTKNAIFLQGGQNLPPLPLVGLIINYLFVKSADSTFFESESFVKEHTTSTIKKALGEGSLKT